MPYRSISSAYCSVTELHTSGANTLTLGGVPLSSRITPVLYTLSLPVPIVNVPSYVSLPLRPKNQPNRSYGGRSIGGRDSSGSNSIRASRLKYRIDGNDTVRLVVTDRQLRHVVPDAALLERQRVVIVPLEIDALVNLPECVRPELLQVRLLRQVRVRVRPVPQVQLQFLYTSVPGSSTNSRFAICHISAGHTRPSARANTHSAVVLPRAQSRLPVGDQLEQQRPISPPPDITAPDVSTLRDVTSGGCCDWGDWEPRAADAAAATSRPSACGLRYTSNALLRG
uniref:Uncharacterized protein n=1 Tax=Anopheles coluzzii TaxID=1518534 RepID=A0A8W7PEI4_ANOCL